MPLNGKKILVTEDEPDQQEFISTVLTDAGAEVIAAHNGTQAIELMKSESPDLITLDINMPGVDVLQVMGELCGEEGCPRVCIVSGRPELRRMILDRLNDKNVGFVDKPFSGDDLLAEVRRLLSL